MSTKIREVVVREPKQLKATDRLQMKAKGMGLTVFDYYQRSTFKDETFGTERSYRSRFAIVKDEDGRTIADFEIGELSGFLKGMEYANFGILAVRPPFVPPTEVAAD